jgi:hypothetical protein
VLLLDLSSTDGSTAIPATTNIPTGKVISLIGSTRPTAGVTRLGWEGGFTLETGVRESQENAKKRGAYPKSGARIVGRLY